MIPIHSETDYYYNILANNIFDIIARTEFGRGNDSYSNEKISEVVSRYFEDVISDFGVWHSFVNVCHQLYGRYLPFYEINEEGYCPDEINEEDIRLIVKWSSGQPY